MSHPTADELLLLTYGELPVADVTRVEAHLRDCETCRAQFTRLETAQVALEAAVPRARRSFPRWAIGALAAAAAVAAILLTSTEPSRGLGWRPTSTWSATAGYVTGSAMVDIDAQLTHLEQERPYGLRE